LLPRGRRPGGFTRQGRRLRRAGRDGDVVEEPAVAGHRAVGDRGERDADALAGTAGRQARCRVAGLVEVDGGGGERRRGAGPGGRSGGSGGRAGGADRAVGAAREDRGGRNEEVVRAVHRDRESAAVEAGLEVAAVTEREAGGRRAGRNRDTAGAVRLGVGEVVVGVVGGAGGAAVAEDLAAGLRGAGLDPAPAGGGAARDEGTLGPVGQAGAGLEAVGVAGRRRAARAGAGGRRRLGRVARGASGRVRRLDDVEVGGVAGQAGVVERGRRRRADLGVWAARSGRAEDVVAGRARGSGPRHGGGRLAGGRRGDAGRSRRRGARRTHGGHRLA